MYFYCGILMKIDKKPVWNDFSYSTLGPYCGATFFLGGVLEKMQIYIDKRMAIQVFMQIKDPAQQV